MNGDWLECTRADAEAELEAALDHAADEAHDVLVREGFDEDQIFTGMQKVYVALDQARQRSRASLDDAFTRVKAAH